MSVNDEREYPWLVGEKQLIRDAIEAGKAVVGVCLGSQLIANAAGARVYRNREKEIGWYPLRPIRHEVAGEDFFSFPEGLTVFHWHGETFDLPDGAVALAASDATACQAFQIGRRVIGLQCHLETTPETAADIVEHCADELVPGPYIQPAAEILAADAKQYREINALMDEVLSFVTRDGA